MGAGQKGQALALHSSSIWERALRARPSRPGQSVKGIAPWERAFKARPEPTQQRGASAEDGATQATPEPQLSPNMVLPMGAGLKDQALATIRPSAMSAAVPEKMERA